MKPYPQAFDTLLKSRSNPDAALITLNSTDIEPSVGPTLSNLLDELLTVHDYERQRLGQELHDTAGQLVIALQFSIANLKRVHDVVARDQLFEEIQDTVLRIDQELRSLAFLRYPAELGDRSLGAALQSLASGFGRRTGVDTDFNLTGEATHIDQSISAAILRVAQEALVNIHRHSHATAVQVALDCRDDEIRLTISDNGVGMPRSDQAHHQPGVGLRGMRFRVETLGGRFSIRNLKQGLQVTAVIPIARRRRKAR